MTENKRFKYVEFSKYMLAFEDNCVWKFFHEKDFEDWLNELHEEKERLKKELSEQGTQLDFLKDENIHMRNVLNENKQLKQDNNALIHLLENQSIIIQELHSKLLEYQVKEPIVLTKEDLEIMGKAIGYYSRDDDD